MASNILQGCCDARKGTLGPFSSHFDPNTWLREGLDRDLPEDAHIQVGMPEVKKCNNLVPSQASGRLHVSLTRVYDGQNILVSQFDTREELIQVSLIE